MSSTKPLPERTEAIYRELRSLRRRFRLGGWITLIVGSLLLLLVAAYFSYGYSEISSLRDPELIVSLVGNTVDGQIPIIRQRIENEVNSNSSTWAEQASQQLLAEIPRAREQLEAAALVQADKVIAQIDVLGEKQFRKIIDENRATVQKAIGQLKNDEEISEDIVLGLQLALEKELQIDAANQGDAVRTIVSDLREAIEKLNAGEKLSEEQQAERRVLMLARRWQMETIGEVEYKELDLSVVKELVGDHESKRLRKETAKQSTDFSDAPAAKPKEATKPAEEMKAEAKPAQEPAAKPDAPAEEKPVQKKDASVEEKPADKPADKPEEKKAEEKPAEVKDAPTKEEPAEKPDEAAKPEKKETPAEEKPADKPEEKKEAP